MKFYDLALLCFPVNVKHPSERLYILIIWVISYTSIYIVLGLYLNKKYESFLILVFTLFCVYIQTKKYESFLILVFTLFCVYWYIYVQLLIHNILRNIKNYIFIYHQLSTLFWEWNTLGKSFSIGQLALTN